MRLIAIVSTVSLALGSGDLNDSDVPDFSCGRQQAETEYYLTALG